jgi:hypothetical protein
MRAIRLLCGLALAAAAGCGGSDVPEFPDTAPVKGTVKLKGAAVDGAAVKFLPVNPTEKGVYAAVGTTGSDGSFTVSTFFSGALTKEGAVPGRYRVVVTKMPPADPNAGAHSETGEVKETTSKSPSNVLPKIYSSPDSTTLDVNVQAGQENSYDFDLK